MTIARAWAGLGVAVTDEMAGGGRGVFGGGVHGRGEVQLPRHL